MTANRSSIKVLNLIFAVTAGILMLSSNASAGQGAESGCQGRGPEGGPCSYLSFPGKAVITRIERTARSAAQAEVFGGPGYEGLEVWFRFVPRAADEARLASIAAREQLLSLRNGWYLGPRYLEKYRLSVGTPIPCVLMVIEKGTCAPTVIEFSGIEDADYFEGRAR